VATRRKPPRDLEDARRMLAAPRAAQARYLATLRRVWGVTQGLIAYALAPLLEAWPAEQADSRNPGTKPGEAGGNRGAHIDDDGARGGRRIPRFTIEPESRYNPLRPRPQLPRIWNISDAELRRLWPGLDPLEVRHYAPWAVTRSEVERIAFPGGLRATDDLEQYVRRAIEAARASRPEQLGLDLAEEGPGLTRPPNAFRLRPRYYAPVVLGPDGLPLLPPVPRVVNVETVRRQLEWLDLATAQLVTVEDVAEVVGPAGEALNTTSTRQLERVLGIDLRAGDPAMQRHINQWRDRNVGLIETGLRAREASPRLRPSLLQDVSEVVERGHREGLRVEVLAHDIKQRFDVSDSRAELIARDQTLKLNAQINRQRQMQVGIRKYRWSTSKDSRVRDRHAELEGTIHSWEDPPRVAPGRYEHPGGDYQCRCVSMPIIPGEEE
jgi:SPP1 gp7 family putative phage head morphogenesis protein